MTVTVPRVETKVMTETENAVVVATRMTTGTAVGRAGGHGPPLMRGMEAGVYLSYMCACVHACGWMCPQYSAQRVV